MSLEGKLKDFGIADILQLLSQQQKTGILIVERNEESAEIYFMKGVVVETRSSQHTGRLGEMFVRGGFVTQQQIQDALERQGDTFDYLGQILVRNGLISSNVLQQALLTQMYETFYDILQWRVGQYRFIADKYKKESMLESVPGIVSILLDVLRMIDEWPEIAKIIPTFDLIFATTGTHSADDIEVEEMPVYQLIDGRRCVQEIIDGSLMGRFAACKILVELLQDGIIEVVGRRDAAGLEQEGKLLGIIFGPGAYVMLAACVALSIILSARFPESILPTAFTDEFRESHAVACVRALHQQRITYGLEAFNLLYGRYPRALMELVDAGLIGPGALSDTLRYSVQGRVYDLTIDGM